MKRIPKHVRDEAILICAILASQGRWVDGTFSLEPRRFDRRSRLLVNKALSSPRVRALDRWLCADWQVDYAEAECLLREGWEP
jgi:hypothetical protein